jgi:DNA-binding transcriptional LysR family regulator
VLTVDLLTDSGEAAIELVAANVGVAVMPQSVARAHSRKDVVARPLVDGVETRISLVWPTAGAHPLVDEFIGIVRGRTANSSR